MIADVALDAGTDVETIKAAKVGSITVAEAITDTIAKIGENMTLRRAAALSVGKGAVGDLRAQLGQPTASARSACWSRSNRPARPTSSTALGRMVAMHVAASNPQALDPSGLDPAVVEREKDVLAEKSRQQGKPANVIEKIVESGLKTYYKEVCCSSSLTSTIRQEDRRAGAQGGRGQGRRRRSRSPASCATRSAKASRSRKPTSPPRWRPPPGRS